MIQNRTHFLGVLLLVLLYPAIAPITRHIPNPMVPGASIALQMILPVLSGYFFGPFSGMLTGGCGAAMSAFLYADMFDALAVFPHSVMGFMAGWLVKYESDIIPASAVIIGHILNMAFFIRLGLIPIPVERLGVILLGLATETTIDLVAIILMMAILKRFPRQKDRW